MRYLAALLDVDGTIVDSNDAHAAAWVAAFAQHGRTVAVDEVRSRIGMGGDKLLRQLAGLEAESPEGRAIAESRKAVFAADHLPCLQPTPGARAMIQWLKDQGARIAIATSATEDEVSALLRAAGVDDLVDHVASADDAEESKPDPDIVVAALKKSGAAKDRAVMIGDTPYDIEAAARAGIGTIALRTGGWADGDLRNAIAIFDDPADLLAHRAQFE